MRIDREDWDARFYRAVVAGVTAHGIVWADTYGRACMTPEGYGELSKADGVARHTVGPPEFDRVIVDATVDIIMTVPPVVSPDMAIISVYNTEDTRHYLYKTGHIRSLRAPDSEDRAVYVATYGKWGIREPNFTDYMCEAEAVVYFSNIVSAQLVYDINSQGERWKGRR